MATQTSDHPEYQLKSVKLPYLSGFPLKLMASLIEGPLSGLIIPSLLKNAGITWLEEQVIEDDPTYTPLHPQNIVSSTETRVPQKEFPLPAKDTSGFHFRTVYDYADAYRTGATTPEEVAKAALDAIEASDKADPPLRAFIASYRDNILKQAQESTKRFRDGTERGIFDGVPVIVKDEVDMVPYPTTVGTSFLGTKPAKEDATPVARLREAGALLLGKANMHEIGIGVTGLNPHHGTPRNPYAPDHFTGGSSSGSAAAVAAGLVPVAVGADGGGSIRIPSAFCGVFGIKATYGRVSTFGSAPLDWSVGHVGPIAATATDLALGYAIMAGADSKDPHTWFQPAPTLERFSDTDLNGLRIGVYWQWFHHAESDVVNACKAFLPVFEQLGASIEEIVLPGLEEARIAHTITIATEMAEALAPTYAEHHKEHGLDVRINLAFARHFKAITYVQSQRVRTQLMRSFNDAFKKVDVILTPATAIPAPPIPPGALKDGESDLTKLVEIMRFVTPANLTGSPAVSFPVGYTPQGLPIGMQAIGKPWDEATLLRLAFAAEKNLVRQKPKIYFDLLS